MGPLSGAWSKGRSRKYAYYICNNRCGAQSIAVTKLNDSLIDFLGKITPSKKQLDLFLMLLRKKFNQNILSLRTKKETAEQQIVELKELRQALVLKNLKGTYSDELFQEQDKIIKNKIGIAEQLLGGTIFDKYTIDDVDKFMKDKFSNLGKTYSESEPGERRVLLGSIAPSGLAWQYSGLSNQQFSPEYQAILDIQKNNFALSAR